MFAPFKKRRIYAEKNIYLMWGLIALELLMSFSFLGYIHIKPISITLVYIPVLLAGCLLGPMESMLMGIVFGAASMWKASAFYVEGGDVLFSPVMSGKPIQSILLSVGARALFGLIAGLLYMAVKRGKHPFIGVFLVTFVGKTLHSFCVYSFMGVLFPEAGFSLVNILDGTFRNDFILFPLIQNAVVLPCYIFWQSKRAKALLERIHTVNQMETAVAQDRKKIFVIIIGTFILSCCVAWYFINRIRSVMARYGILLSDEIAYDIRHLQIQFLMGIISLFTLVALVILLYQKNFNYLYYEAKLDELTGLLGRGQFFLAGRKMLEKMKYNQDSKTGYFVILDIDHFKAINDTYGHPEGDRVLKEVANSLKDILKNKVILGRLGGDEFVVLDCNLMMENEMRELLYKLKEKIGHINVGDEKVACSIGAVSVKKGYTIEELYHNADRLLYEAKKNGRNQFVFRPEKHCG